MSTRPREGPPRWHAERTAKIDEVEGVEKYLVVSALVPDEIERGNTVVIADDSFTVDDAAA